MLLIDWHPKAIFWIKITKRIWNPKKWVGTHLFEGNCNDTFSSFPPFSFFFFFFFRRYELPWLFPLCTSLIFRQRLLPWLKNCSVSRPTLPLLSLTSRFSLQLILTWLRSVYTCVLSCLNPEQHAGTLWRLEDLQIAYNLILEYAPFFFTDWGKAQAATKQSPHWHVLLMCVLSFFLFGVCFFYFL